MRFFENPDELVVRARVEHAPVAAWCLFSGGHDSTVLAHRCREHYQGLVWIDTGTAVPGVEEFVREYAEWIGKPLRVMDAGDAFRVMVMGDLVWWARFITAHDRDPDLSIEAFIARDSREHGRVSGGELGQPPHGFPGPGAHGAFASANGEREMLKALYPDWFAGIEALEAEARAAGVRWCRWGGYDIHGNRAGEISRQHAGMLCESCEARQHRTASRRRDGARIALCNTPARKDRR